MEHIVEVDGREANLWRRKAISDKDYEEARDGDHLMTPFQCDLCIFRRIKGVNPDTNSHSDKLTLSYIRRSNLDAFWSRARGTVRNNKGIVERTIEGFSPFGLFGPFYDKGPTPSYDHAGYETSMALLIDSKRPGKYDGSHKQWDSTRRVKSAIGNFERASSNYFWNNVAFVDDNKGTCLRLQCLPSFSMWYQRFAQGCRGRMGQIIKRDLAISVDLWKLLLGKCEERMLEAENFEDGARWTMIGAYLTFIYVLSLRGPEGFQVEISLLRKHKELHNGLVWIPLVGKLKGDSQPGVFLLRSVPCTGSGIDVLLWRDRLLVIHENAGREAGPAFCDDQGFLLSSLEVNDSMWELLEELYDVNPVQFPKAIESKEMIRDLIQINRSGRRSSESQATKAKVHVDDKMIVNRWTRSNNARGKAPTEMMRIGYAQQDLLDKCFERYTKAM